MTNKLIDTAEPIIKCGRRHPCAVGRLATSEEESS